MDANASLAAGKAVPLVLVPGLMCDSRIFIDQTKAFPSSTVADYGGADSLGEMARRSLHAAPNRFALLGHSMGARVALEIYRQAPERVERLALLSTGVHPLRPGEREKRYALRDIGRNRGMEALVDAWLPPMIGAEAARDRELVERLRSMCIDTGIERCEAQIEALLNRPEVESLLPRIAVPTFVAVGSEDRWAPPEQHAEFAALIPHARFVLIEGAGHMLPAEKPNELNAVIAAWLGERQPHSNHASKETIDD